MEMRVCVSQENIDDGAHGDGMYCPIANAFQDIGAVFVDVHGCVSVEFDGGVLMEGDLPLAACDFIDAFDWGEAVEPFEFDIELKEAA